MTTTHDDLILEAEFDARKIITYYWIGLIPFCIFIVTIPIVIIVAIVYALVLHRMVANWSARLTTRNLHVKKGIFLKVEKTIPLEKITDLSMTEGPIMRLIGIKRLSVETAGQSSAVGASLITLLGVVDTDGFRAQVLAQRDRGMLSEATAVGGRAVGALPSGGELREIAETLHRMERLLERLADGQR